MKFILDSLTEQQTIFIREILEHNGAKRLNITLQEFLKPKSENVYRLMCDLPDKMFIIEKTTTEDGTGKGE